MTLQTDGFPPDAGTKRRVLSELVNAIFSHLYGTSSGRYILNGVARWVGKRKITVRVRDCHLNFLAGLGHSERRAANLELKEPETLSWIDDFESDSLFWDVGASTGIYSVYAAVTRKSKVIAIEPSPYNTPIIAENLRLNNIERQVTVLPIALSSESSPVTFELESDEIGSSQHQLITEDSHAESARIQYGTVAFSIDDLIDHMKIPRPNYIKIDVDGLEHLVLQGARKCLNEIRGVLIEIPQDPDRQQKVNLLLAGAGLSRTSESRYNAIWERLP